MTKEELKGQIREIVREWWNCAEHVFPSILVDKLTDFAEPREKRIAELEERVWRQKKRMVEKTKKIAEFEAQIEKMKCGQNCKFEYWINTGGCYDQKCRFTGLDCTNCKDKWKGKWEND